MNTKSFATRSQWVTNHNFPTVPGVHILGLDMGYSAPKIVYENGQIVFPNFCKKLEGELIGELPKGAIVYENPAGDRYYVGKMALNTLSEDSVVAEDSLFGRNHYLHSDFRVVFDTALGLALWNIDTDGTDLFLQTGLPPAYMTKDEPYIRAAMTGTHEFSLIVEGQKKNFSVSITNEQIDVMSQPMGTVNSLLFGDNGKYSAIAGDVMRNNLLIFDAGFKTLDTFFIHANQLESQGTNPNLGMYRILSEARAKIRDDFGIEVSIPMMQTVLRTGKVTVNDAFTLTSREYPVDKYIENATIMVADEALDSIKDYIFEIKYLVMTGGTSEAWFERFNSRLEKAPVTILRGNATTNLAAFYANARGYYMNRYKKLGGKA